MNKILCKHCVHTNFPFITLTNALKLVINFFDSLFFPKHLTLYKVFKHLAYITDASIKNSSSDSNTQLKTIKCVHP